MADLQARLEEAETKVKNNSNANILDDEIECILHEFEQAEYSNIIIIESISLFSKVFQIVGYHSLIIH